jgi:ankyrin repeat protein
MMTRQPLSVTDEGFEHTALASAVLDGDVDRVRRAIANGSDANEQFTNGQSILELALYHGFADIVEVLLAAGARVPQDVLEPLGDVDITDWKITSKEKEAEYAKAASLLIDRGASPNVIAYNGKPLIESFSAHYYPQIHAVLRKAIDGF